MRATVDESWRKLFGTEVSRGPGIRVVRDAPNFIDRIFLLRLGDGLTIAAPSGVDVPTDIEVDEAFTREFAASLSPGLVLGPSWHGYANGTTFQSQPACDCRRVTDPGGFDEHPDDWAEGGFEPDAPWYACFDESVRVAMGNMTHFNGTNGDVGLMTHPAHRRKGHATRLASAMIAEALETRPVVRYRALFTNVGSLAGAQKLGFVQDGANIVVRLDER